MKQRKFLKTATPYLFIMPWIIGFLVFTIGPLILSLIMSFFDWPLTTAPTFRSIQTSSVIPFFHAAVAPHLHTVRSDLRSAVGKKGITDEVWIRCMVLCDGTGKEGAFGEYDWFDL